MRKNTDVTGYLESFTALSGYIYNSPVGEIVLFSDEYSLKTSAFQHRILHFNRLKKRIPFQMSRPVKNAVSFLDAYFDGIPDKAPVVQIASKKKTVNPGNGCQDDILMLDITGFSDKETDIYRALLGIPWGKTISYRGLSEKAGIHKAARFAGNTMAKNYFPLIIPCHRVIKSDGSMGNYSGGVHIKEFLLNHERIISV